jgi:hypothetical protein
MTEQSAAPPSLPTDNVKPKRKWRWLKITVGIIAAGFLAIVILGSYNSLDLELARRDLIDAAHDGKIIEMTNVGSKPVKLVHIAINDRPDCSVSRLSFVDNSPLFPSVMKIGDKISVLSSCQIVRATVETDLGSNTYSFSR